ncbi:hypothetical protein ACLMJK_008414 [Lecanora helva]
MPQPRFPENDVPYPSNRPLKAKLERTFKEGNIRRHLRLWQAVQEGSPELVNSLSSTLNSQSNTGENSFTQSGEDESFKVVAPEEEGRDVLEDDELIDISSDEPVPDVLKNEPFLRRGDLVELKAGGQPILAIFVRDLIYQCQFYTMRGEWLHMEKRYGKFAVPYFAHPNDLKDILPYLPRAEVAEEMVNMLFPLDASAPRSAGAKLLEKMSSFQLAADNVFRENADRLNRVYELIAPKTGEGTISMTLGDIAMIVLQKKTPAELTPAMMWAVHRALKHCQNIQVDYHNHRQNIIYEIRPLQSLANMKRVREWVREFQEDIIKEATESYDIDSAMATTQAGNPMVSFVRKAREGIKKSRQTRALAPNGSLGPSSIKKTPSPAGMEPYKIITTTIHFNAKERLIVRFMDAWALSSYLNKTTHFPALGPMILRAVGMYDGYELDGSIGFTFLQELGLISPWENRLVHNLTNLRFPGHDDGHEQITKLREKAYQELENTEVKDSMKSFRKDWADLPVFCIDNADTVERDDGISLEFIEGSESEYWIHTHVANPSAFIDPDSASGRYAAQLHASVYFPERKYPMLFPGITARQFSLANGRPCLTFSARVSTSGDVLEKKITPGIVNNVHHLTDGEVSEVLGIEEDGKLASMSTLSVGQTLASAIDQKANRAKVQLPELYVTSLRKLLDLGEAVRQRRINNGALPFPDRIYGIRSHPKVFLGSDATPFRLHDNVIRRYEGDPTIIIETMTSRYVVVKSMVSDIMLLAGEVAAAWCMERRIPVPYRGVLRNPEPASLPGTSEGGNMDPRSQIHSGSTPEDIVHYIRIVGETAVSSSPLEHLHLGLPAYVKVTSPLRRYVDLYAHWQIEAALRHEAATNTSLVDNANTTITTTTTKNNNNNNNSNTITDESYLRFSRTAVENFAERILQRERKLNNTQAASTRHWIIQAFFRAFYFGEGKLPKTFEVSILKLKLDQLSRQGWIAEWNLHVRVGENETTDREGGVREGDLWETKIKNVSTYERRIEVEPLRLIRRK